jgi:prepilin-type N-terminal cleavage/methylation domain-containing protein
MKSVNCARKRLEFGSARAGFTLVELLIVIVIGAALMSYAIPSFTRMSSSRNAQNARDALVWMGSRARSRAIERGEAQLLEINPATERAWIVRRNTGVALASDTLEKVDFSSTHKTLISTAANTVITVCYSPRGYAFSCSANSPAANVDVTFTHAGKTAIARVKPLGQMERL